MRIDTPVVTERPAQPYMGIQRTVTMTTIADIAGRLPFILGWLTAKGVPPSGAPFFKYNEIDMEKDLTIAVGVPVESALEPDGEIFAGEVPAGRYVTVSHTGHPDELLEVTRQMLDWAGEQGLEFDRDGDSWVSRLEIYKTDPAVEPDMSSWETELAFKLA
jgi:effector-binding domain-containing protein